MSRYVVDVSFTWDSIYWSLRRLFAGADNYITGASLVSTIHKGSAYTFLFALNTPTHLLFLSYLLRLAFNAWGVTTFDHLLHVGLVLRDHYRQHDGFGDINLTLVQVLYHALCRHWSATHCYADILLWVDKLCMCHLLKVTLMVTLTTLIVRGPLYYQRIIGEYLA